MTREFARLHLFKFHAYGNDFLVTEDPIQEGLVSGTARVACNRHFGVGADGLLLLHEKAGGFWSLRIINADGSESGMSGNGGRCAAAYLHFFSRQSSGEIRFITSSGEKTYTRTSSAFPEAYYESLMGIPSFAASDIPFSAAGAEFKEVNNFRLQSQGLDEQIFALSVGNPQCVVFRESLPEIDELEKLGSKIETHPFFPERTNVSFVKVVSRSHVKIRIWERGVGVTTSSGTGSCGAAVASIRTGKTDGSVRVETDSGSQIVEWEPESQVKLTGGTAFIGEVWIPEPELTGIAKS